MAKWLARESVDAISVSPMLRARETAAPLEAVTGHVATVVEGIAEFDRHAKDYVPVEELRAANDPRWLAMVEGRYFTEGPISPEDFRNEVVAAVDGIIAAHAGQTVAVVCHGGVINAYMSTVIGLEGPMFFEPTYTSCSRIMASQKGYRTLVSLNETAHLRGLD